MPKETAATLAESYVQHMALGNPLFAVLGAFFLFNKFKRKEEFNRCVSKSWFAANTGINSASSSIFTLYDAILDEIIEASWASKADTNGMFLL